MKWITNPFTNKAGMSVFSIMNLVKFRGWTVRLHRFEHPDDPGCFHSHPAVAYRLILWGGYVEETPDGAHKSWRPLMLGRVDPDFVHRIHSLRNGRTSITLWVRGPITHKVLFGCVD